MVSLRTEKAIKKVLEAKKRGEDIQIVSPSKSRSISFSFFSGAEKIATFTLASLISKRGPKRKKK